jgi:small conductance mechanosensitive channel
MIGQFTLWSQTALKTGLRVATILLVALILQRLLKTITTRLIQLAPSDTRTARMREQHTRTLAGLLYSAGSAVILIGALFTMLAEFGINIAPMAAAAALASLGLGLGTQHLVRDLVNGFFLVFEDQYVVGDTVRIGEITGRVEHLTLRRTVLRDANGAIVTIPNGDIRQVANLSRDWAQAHVDVPVPPDMSIEHAFEVLDAVSAELRSDPAWSAAVVDGPRVLGVETLGRDGAILRLQVRTMPLRENDVARELRRRIHARFLGAKPAPYRGLD